MADLLLAVKALTARVPPPAERLGERLGGVRRCKRSYRRCVEMKSTRGDFGGNCIFGENTTDIRTRGGLGHLGCREYRVAPQSLERTLKASEDSCNQRLVKNMVHRFLGFLRDPGNPPAVGRYTASHPSRCEIGAV